MLLLIPLLLVLTLTQGAPLLGEDYSGRIEDEYIVIYEKEADDVVVGAYQSSLSRNIKRTYNISDEFRGFSAHLTKEELSKVLETPFVKVVHCNGVVNMFCTQNQNPTPSWGLARLNFYGALAKDQSLPLQFAYPQDPGLNVLIYILDTGVMKEHKEFNGRVAPGKNFVDGEPDADIDQNGHGTHCAGTAAGNTYGIARNARIVPVKVLGRSGGGTFEGVIAGIDYVANEYNPDFPCIASMSLGAGSDGGMNAAVAAAIRRGIPFSVAAGNSADDACFYYPASAEGAITVGSTELGDDSKEDMISYFSNVGKCVEIFAPGSAIPSSYIPNPDSYAVLSGTSMACPHVAGLGATILGQNPKFTPAQLLEALVNQYANKDVINEPLRDSPNLLLFNSCNK